MCGHGIIALVTALLETSTISAKGQHTPVNLDTPAGLVRATAHLDSRGHVEQVSFLNVPSFLYARDVEIELPEYGRLNVDIAFGGTFYVFIAAEQVGLKVTPENTEQLMTAGEAIKKAVNSTMSINHPVEADLSFVYGTILTDVPENPEHYSRNVCIFANGEVDRSPTGTGVSARLALHHAKGEIVDTSAEVALSQDLFNMQICRHFLWYTYHIGWYTKFIGLVCQCNRKGNNSTVRNKTPCYQ